MLYPQNSLNALLKLLIAEKVFEKSRKLLEGTSYSVGEIALMCGFSTQASFSRFFKNRCGVSPLNYKNNGSLKVKLF